MQNPTKKQHFVPQFYLKAFADERGQLRKLDLVNQRIGKARPYQSFGYAHYFYAVETGVPDDASQEVERWLQRTEDAIAKEVPKIVNKIEGNDHIEESERYILAVLMSMLWLRSPGMRAQLHRMEEQMTKQMMRFYAPQRVQQFASETGTPLSDEERSEMVTMMESGSYDLTFNNAHHLRFMVESLGFGGPGFTNMFYGHKWKIYLATGRRRFITTDSPVAEWWLPPQTFYGASFLERNKYFALTPEILIELTYPVGSTKVKRKTLFVADDDTVMMFNVLIADRTGKSVYSGDRTILDDMCAGLTRPDVPVLMFYDRFKRPWDEAEKRKGSLGGQRR